jgi:uncharacterized protein
MIIVDLNVLVYAVNRDAERHQPSRAWLESAMAGPETIGLPWLVLLGFLRVTTTRAIGVNLPITTALGVVQGWLDEPVTTVLEPTGRHLDHLATLLTAGGMGGNLVQDAHLAALALEHRATVVSFDRDFDRFPGVRRREPA